jgi:hypothetical protein
MSPDHQPGDVGGCIEMQNDPIRILRAFDRSLLAEALSLRFNHEEFCDGEKPIAKLSGSQFSSAQALLLRAG